jgi:NAD(P)-dependent dehydrogenase (short-subunit alcohol dehydrogenase family)
VKDTGAELIVIFGGRSEIGLELATRLAPGATVLLLARRADKLDDEVAAVREAGAAAVHVGEFDADDLASHAPLVESIVAEHGPIGTAVLAFGILGDQARAEKDPGHAAAIVHTDFVAQVSLLTVLANAMQSACAGSIGDERLARRASIGDERLARRASIGDERLARRASIVAFSSVAGVRVRRANYVYGSAKAGLDGFCSGLADALHGSGVHLLVVRPGFVIGRMTQGMTPAPFSSTPAQVATATAGALAKRRRTVWVPWALRPVFIGMRMLPQFVWRRMPR